MLAARIRSLLSHLRGTPLHPQWLLRDDRKSAADFLSAAHGQVLDIGCANRRVKPYLPDGCSYLGLDYPPTGVELYGARPDILADAAQIPLMDESVDTVLMLDVLEHLRFPNEALQESARVLRSGGKLLISIPFLYPIHDAPHDYQRLTVHGLRRDLERAGFRVSWVRPSVGSVESAGLLMCLALAGAMYESWLLRSPWLLVAPLVLSLIPVVNIACWVAGKCLPTWPALTSGYRLLVVKP